MAANQKYLDPAGLHRVGNMELVAKQVVEGFLTGRHRSPYHGFSVEYLDHRSYSPATNPATWTGRSSPARTSTTSSCTRTRRTCGPNPAGLLEFDELRSGDQTKLSWGSYLAAALTYLLLRQNEPWGCRVRHRRAEVHSSQGTPDPVPPLSRFARRVEPGGETDGGGRVHEAAERTNGGG
ncbi:MAG: hypothetical protein CM1200mP2_14230 [Planctomycetaceae bacterium]|nr:MAG: hypothetical protein CM1200mP2_14230 [Planctomycetaceae bacterium]